MELQSWDSQASTPHQDSDNNDSNRSTNASYKLPKLSLDNYTTVICFLAEFGVLVCKQHCTGVVNLDKHLLEQHATSAKLRKEIVQHFAHYERTGPRAVELPEQPADPIEELGTPLAGLCCRTCYFLTVCHGNHRGSLDTCFTLVGSCHNNTTHCP
jgi:hypothetical protein